MGDEIRISATLRYAKNQESSSITTAFTADQTGSAFESGLQTVGTSEEALVKGDIGTIGYVGVRNTDATNFVELGAVTAEYSVKLAPGEGCVMPWKRTNIYAKADTASCKVAYTLIEL